MPRITELFCFAIFDGDEDGEGVPAVSTRMGPMPLMGADVARVDNLMPYAQIVANETGKPLRIYKFSVREQIGEVSPQAPPDPPVVHILQHGFALCGFAGITPGHWPAGHLWAHPSDARSVTCLECRAKL